MSSQEVFWMAAGIGGLFCLIFAVNRSQREPTRLRMDKPAPPGDRKPVVSDAMKRPVHNPRKPTFQDSIHPATVEVVQSEARIKSINVIFNYNGHSWDAHEVLGVPAGAPVAMVKDAYDRAMRNTDPASHEFVKAAYQAITKLKSV